jgi:hypothetical protein
VQPVHGIEPRWQLFALENIILGPLLGQFLPGNPGGASVQVYNLPILVTVATPVEEGT